MKHHCNLPEDYLSKYVMWTPNRDEMKDADDLFCLQMAHLYGAYVLDNDNYRDWLLRVRSIQFV